MQLIDTNFVFDVQFSFQLCTLSVILKMIIINWYQAKKEILAKFFLVKLQLPGRQPLDLEIRFQVSLKGNKSY